jgi:hypothetical protein
LENDPEMAVGKQKVRPVFFFGDRVFLGDLNRVNTLYIQFKHPFLLRTTLGAAADDHGGFQAKALAVSNASSPRSGLKAMSAFLRCRLAE